MVSRSPTSEHWNLQRRIRMKHLLQRILCKVALGKHVERAIDLAVVDRVNPQFVLPGHFYSPIPELEEVRGNEENIFNRAAKVIPGISLNESGQVELLEKFVAYYRKMPFYSEKTDGLRYFLANDYYNHADGIFLFCMIMHVKPRRIVEVGSGYSSCAMVDTNELFFGGSILLTFIDPFPDRFLSLLEEHEAAKLDVISNRVQDVRIELFDQLRAGDILFIDSSHISKVGSDVNYIFFEILPRLKKGVYVHFHDIFFPFEYPKSWIYSGRAFNECYVLRAFLQFNSHFKIMLFNAFLEQFYKEWLASHMPLCLKGRGASVWLQKL